MTDTIDDCKYIVGTIFLPDYMDATYAVYDPDTMQVTKTDNHMKATKTKKMTPAFLACVSWALTEIENDTTNHAPCILIEKRL